LVLTEGLGDPRLPYGRDVKNQIRIRPLNRELADAGSAPAGLVVSAAPPQAPAAGDAVSSSFVPPLCGAVSRLVYAPRGVGRRTSARRAYALGGGGGKIPLIWGHSGPPSAPLLLFNGEASAQLGTSRPVSAAVWSGLGRSRGELPSILNNGVDQTLIMALRRTLVRSRNEVASILSRRIGDRDAERLYSSSTAKTARPPSGGGVWCRRGRHQHGLDRLVRSAIFRLGGPAHGGPDAGDASASAVSLPTPLWGGIQLFFPAPLWDYRRFR